MKWILILSMFVSCNALKILTNGETNIPEGFFSGNNESLIFFSCNSANYCVFDTETEQSQQITTGAGLTVAGQGARFGNSILITGEGKLLKYTPGDTSASEIESTGVTQGLGIINGFAYYVKTDDLFRYDGSTVTQISAGGILPSPISFTGGEGRLFICRNTGSDTVQEVNPSTGAALNLSAANSSGGGAVANIFCTSNSQMLVSYGSLLFNNSNSVMQYNLNSSFLDNNLTAGASGYIQFMIPDKAIYFNEGAGPYTLYRYDIQTKSVQTISSDVSWGGRSAAEVSDDRIYFTERVSSLDELFVYSKSNNTSTQISSFAGAYGSIGNVIANDKSLFLFSSTSGILKFDLATQNISQISPLSHDNMSFIVIKK